MVKALKARINAGERLNLFAVGRMFHPNIVHYVGMQGEFDALWIDVEHAGLGVTEIEAATTVAKAYGMESFVRVPPTDYATVTRCFESGASGVIAAQVDSARQAEEIVTWAKFHPRGRRGLNPLGHDGRFGATPLEEFTRRANEETFVGVQIETANAVEEVDAIAAIEGLDMIFVGPSDLSQALGATGDFTNERFTDAIDSVAIACREHGKHWGAVTPTPEFAETLIDKGCTLISAMNDVKLVTTGFVAMREKFDPIW